MAYIVVLMDIKKKSHILTFFICFLCVVQFVILFFFMQENLTDRQSLYLALCLAGWGCHHNALDAICDITKGRRTAIRKG